MIIYEPSVELTEEYINTSLDVLLKLSALKASKLFEKLDIYNVMNRPRSPEEISTTLDVNTLINHFS